MARLHEEPRHFSDESSVQACILPQNTGYLWSRHKAATCEIGGSLMIMVGVIAESTWRISGIFEVASRARLDDDFISDLRIEKIRV